VLVDLGVLDFVVSAAAAAAVAVAQEVAKLASAAEDGGGSPVGTDSALAPPLEHRVEASFPFAMLGHSEHSVVHFVDLVAFDEYFLCAKACPSVWSRIESLRVRSYLKDATRLGVIPCLKLLQKPSARR
jgi:hypothetical protein